MSDAIATSSRVKVAKVDETLKGQQVLLKGWVRTARAQKTFIFVELNDGSCLHNLQVIVDQSMDGYEDLKETLGNGAAVEIVGEVVESPGKGQSVEVKAHAVRVVGTCDASSYPMQKKRHSLEFLRSLAHLRPRTNALGAVTRVRNALAWATHRFFQENGFLYIHTPIVTASDCEGAGELFRVTTLDPSASKAADFEDDFFKRAAYLTVSGQLNAEIYACAMSDVYTFGPTFRAENSNTSRHLAEFWMIEPEMAFTDLQGNMDNAEAYLKYVITHVLDNCEEDLTLFDKFISKGLIDRLSTVRDAEFTRITYTDAIDILLKSGKSFEYPVVWGVDMQSEHERFLCEEHFKGPVIVTDYPRDIKAFYMRCNDDGKTVAAMDILVPGVGELVGGSQREERHDVLGERMDACGVPREELSWYLDLRRYGSVPHAGYGVGFERLVQYATGMENIRDVIPFPRYPGHAEF